MCTADNTYHTYPHILQISGCIRNPQVILRGQGVRTPSRPSFQTRPWEEKPLLPFCQISNAFGSRGDTLAVIINFACSKYHHLPSPLPGKQLNWAIATAQIYRLECTCIFVHLTSAYLDAVHVSFRLNANRLDHFQKKKYVYTDWL